MRACPSGGLRLNHARMERAARAGSQRISLSQIRTTCQPAFTSSLETARSLLRFRAILAIQYSALCRRSNERLRRAQCRPCQKSPSQKTTTRAARKTISGLPGKSGAYLRYRSPSLVSSRRSSTSCNESVFRFARFDRDAASEAGLSPRKLGTPALAVLLPSARLAANTHSPNGCAHYDLDEPGEPASLLPARSRARSASSRWASSCSKPRGTGR